MTRMEARMSRTPTPRVAARQEALRAIIEANAPLTVRRAFYIAVGEGIYPKNEAGYDQVIDDSNLLRDQGAIGYEDIIDPTRIVREADIGRLPRRPPATTPASSGSIPGTTCPVGLP
jgi:hypothetical protein